MLTLADLAEVSPRMAFPDKVAWLRARGLVHDFAGVEVVIYGDVLAALRGDRRVAPVAPAPVAPDPWDTLPRASAMRGSR